jgi:hypothetical protein
MAAGQWSTVLHDITKFIGANSGGHATEDAFTTLVQSHGPLVWRVCKRVLRNDQDVEDAFQATSWSLPEKQVWCVGPTVDRWFLRLRTGRPLFGT